MKIAVLGGGGFRAPLAWQSVAGIADEAVVDRVVLYDIDGARLARVGAVIEGLRRERGGPEFHTTTDVVDAVDGADVVFCAIRVGGLEGRVVDETVPLREGVLGQETVGPGGICFALRTVPVMLELAEAVRRHAPSAWFLNFTNPAGLVTEALHSVLDHRVVGICDSPAALCGRVAAALGRSVHDLGFDYAGLNHLGWLLAVWDGDRDLLPGLLAEDERLESLEEARLFGRDHVRALGMIPNEYLVYYEAPGDIVAASQRAGATRAELLLADESRFYSGSERRPAEVLAAWRKTRDLRFGTYMAEAWDAVDHGAPNKGATQAPPEPSDGGPGESGYAEVAAAFIRALARDKGDTLILNVVNRGLLPWLDDDAVVEVPCAVTATGPRPLAARPLPAPQAALVARVKEVERITIRAAVTGSRSLALEAIACHPVVPSRGVAERILDGYLTAWPDLGARLK